MLPESFVLVLVALMFVFVLVVSVSVDVAVLPESTVLMLPESFVLVLVALMLVLVLVLVLVDVAVLPELLADASVLALELLESFVTVLVASMSVLLDVTFEEVLVFPLSFETVLVALMFVFVASDVLDVFVAVFVLLESFVTVLVASMSVVAAFDVLDVFVFVFVAVFVLPLSFTATSASTDRLFCVALRAEPPSTSLPLASKAKAMPADITTSAPAATVVSSTFFMIFSSVKVRLNLRLTEMSHHPVKKASLIFLTKF